MKKLIALIMIIVTLFSFGNVDVHAAEHVHKWVWQTHTVHHDEVYHIEYEYSEPFDKPIFTTKIRCHNCKGLYDSVDDLFARDPCYAISGSVGWTEVDVVDHYEHHDAEIIGEHKVIDKEAYDEEVKDYLYCSECSERNSFPFVDVPDDSNYINAVVWAYESEPRVVEGITANKFKPFNQCSRAQVVSFIWRMKGKPGIEDTGISFSDVHESDFYYEPVLWAAYNGITSGKTADTFAPGDTCTRAQFVTFLWRLEGMPDPHMNNNPFYDLPDNASYRDAVLWAYENDITKGVGTTKFSPEGVINRAQTVMFLHRYYEYLENHTTHTHSWDSGKVTAQPTCTAAGTKTYTCTSCGVTKTETIKATGHSWGNSYKTIIETHDTVLGWETHYMSNGLDLTELYGITSDAACQEFIINHADSYGGYSTEHISYVVEKAYVINAINHQCTNCGIEETLSTEKEYIE